MTEPTIHYFPRIDDNNNNSNSNDHNLNNNNNQIIFNSKVQRETSQANKINFKNKNKQCLGITLGTVLILFIVFYLFYVFVMFQIRSMTNDYFSNILNSYKTKRSTVVTTKMLITTTKTILSSIKQ